MDFSKLPIIGGIITWLDTEDVSFGTPLVIIGFLLFGIGLYITGVSQSQVLTFMFASAPLWLPFITFSIFFYIYMDTVGKAFYLYNGRTTFEVKLPQEVFKSPEAMENVFSQIYSAQSPDNLMETYLEGKRPLPYSFELVSKGGDVKFYVNVPGKKAPEAFLANMYAQYPNVEVVEQELDYTAELPHDLKGHSFMSFHFMKKEEEVLPIKTYIDLKLDMLPKEEEKSDPMTPLLEVLASIEPHKQVWVQFICIPHRKKNFKNGQLRASPTWETAAKAKIDELMQRETKTKLGEAEFEGMPRLTLGERSTVEAIERNIEKYPWEFACRWLYISNKENNYDGAFYARMIRALSAWDIRGRNGIGMIWRTDFNYNFISDPFNKIRPALKKQELKEYKLRKLFPKTSAMQFKVMSSEELATIWHLPGKVALTPTLNRVPSTRGEAPGNLPIGTIQH